MSRIRTIKPEFWTSEQVMECSPLARLAFIGMWNFCDDQGVHPASAKTLKAEVFPADDISAASVEAMVCEMIEHGLVLAYEAQGKAWWYVTGWKHQLIKNPSAPKYPPPESGSPAEKGPKTTPVLPQYYPSTTVGEDPVKEGKGREIVKEGIKVKNNAAGHPEVEGRHKPAASAAVRFDAAAFLIEQGADPQTAADYLTLRKGKKAASTQTAMRQVAIEAEKAGMDMQAAIEMCCSRGWAGFKAEWVEQTSIRAGPQRAEKFDPVAYINRNRTSPLETANVIDIAAERLA